MLECDTYESKMATRNDQENVRNAHLFANILEAHVLFC